MQIPHQVLLGVKAYLNCTQTQGICILSIRMVVECLLIAVIEESPQAFRFPYLRWYIVYIDTW